MKDRGHCIEYLMRDSEERQQRNDTKVNHLIFILLNFLFLSQVFVVPQKISSSTNSGVCSNYSAAYPTNQEFWTRKNMLILARFTGAQPRIDSQIIRKEHRVLPSRLIFIFVQNCCIT